MRTWGAADAGQALQTDETTVACIHTATNTTATGRATNISRTDTTASTGNPMASPLIENRINLVALADEDDMVIPTFADDTQSENPLCMTSLPQFY